MLNRVAALFALGISLAGAAAQADPLDAWIAPRIDFSHAGYRGGGVVLPSPPATVVVEPGLGDDGKRIMAAIDLVSRLSPDALGHRGVVQLAAGDYQVAGQLRIAVGGVVLRGSGSTITATGHDRRTLIAVRGEPGPATSAETRAIVADVEAGAVEIRLNLSKASRSASASPCGGPALKAGSRRWAWTPSSDGGPNRG